MTIAMNQNLAAAAIPGIDVTNKPQGKARKREKQSQPIPALSSRTRRIITIGVAFAGLCAAALSAPTLFNLARLGHVPLYLAWLLPACLDGYAITSIQFGNLVPADHPAHGAAKRNARHALLLSVGGNFAYHVLVLAGSMLPTWVPIVLLVVILSLPPFIVDRLLHLHSLASGSDSGLTAAGPQGGSNGKAATPPATAAPAAATATPVTATGAAMPEAAKRGGNGKPRQRQSSSAGAAAPNWGDLALPLWQEYVRQHNGEAPTAPVLAGRLRTAYPNLKVPGSPRSERNIRSATEALAAARSASAVKIGQDGAGA